MARMPKIRTKIAVEFVKARLPASCLPEKGGMFEPAWTDKDAAEYHDREDGGYMWRPGGVHENEIAVAAAELGTTDTGIHNWLCLKRASFSDGTELQLVQAGCSRAVFIVHVSPHPGKSRDIWMGEDGDKDKAFTEFDIIFNEMVAGRAAGIATPAAEETKEHLGVTHEELMAEAGTLCPTDTGYFGWPCFKRAKLPDGSELQLCQGESSLFFYVMRVVSNDDAENFGDGKMTLEGGLRSFYKVLAEKLAAEAGIPGHMESIPHAPPRPCATICGKCGYKFTLRGINVPAHCPGCQSTEKLEVSLPSPAPEPGIYFDLYHDPDRPKAEEYENSPVYACHGCLDTFSFPQGMKVFHCPICYSKDFEWYGVQINEKPHFTVKGLPVWTA